MAKSSMRSPGKAGKSEKEEISGWHHILDERHGGPLFNEVQIMSKAAGRPEGTAGRRDNSSVGFVGFCPYRGTPFVGNRTKRAVTHDTLSLGKC